MTVPKYEKFMLPVLKLVSKGDLSAKACISAMSEQFSLSAEDQAQMLPSGTARLLDNRVHWAITYLVKAKLLERPQRGYVRITSRGEDVLAKQPLDINANFLKQFEEFTSFFKTPSDNPATETHVLPAISAEQTPEEQIEKAYGDLNAALKSDLLTRILASEPSFFEHLILDLMVAMGYGGRQFAEHHGKSADGGIDGIINEDPLGLGVIFLQAKRYSPEHGIGVEKIREFAGNLDEKGATNGVFVTTSFFAGPAKIYAQRSPKSIVLIDGDRLTDLLITYDVGVRLHRQISIKKADEDYFYNLD